MPRRRLYSKILEAKCDNATTDYLEGDDVEQGQVLFITFGNAEDETNAPTTIAIGKKVKDTFIPFEEEDSPSAGIRYNTEKTHHVIAGERPAIRFEGATSNDLLRGYLEGYYEEVPG